MVIEQEMFEDFGNMIWTTETGEHVKVKDLSPVKLNEGIAAFQEKSEELRKVIDHKPYKYGPPNSTVNDAWKDLISLKREIDRMIFVLKQYQLYKQENTPPDEFTYWDGDDSVDM